MLATLLATASRVAEPLVIRRGVDDGVIAGDIATLTIASVVYLALLGLQYVFGRWSLQSVGSVAERYLRGLRVRVFTHLMSLDIPYFSRSKAGVLVSRMTSDIDALTQFASEGAFNVVSSVLTVLGVGAAMFFVDSTLALVVMALLPLLALASVVFRRFADRAYQQVREQIGQVLATLQEASPVSGSCRHIPRRRGRRPASVGSTGATTRPISPPPGQSPPTSRPSTS